MEVVVFPRVYEQESSKLTEESKVFIRGRVDAAEDLDGKVICESVQAFDEVRRTLWIKFPTKAAYEEAEQTLFDALAASDGNDGVVIYVENPRAKKNLPPNRNVKADRELVEKLSGMFGEENVKVV